jgi:hypothetical protein
VIKQSFNGQIQASTLNLSIKYAGSSCPGATLVQAKSRQLPDRPTHEITINSSMWEVGIDDQPFE